MSFAALGPRAAAVLWFAWLARRWSGRRTSPPASTTRHRLDDDRRRRGAARPAAAAAASSGSATPCSSAYTFVVGVTVLEAGGHPPAHLAPLTAVTSQTYAVTSVFQNQNDLATYLAICWPFMLGAFFFTRRVRWLGARPARFGLGAAAFVRTGRARACWTPDPLPPSSCSGTSRRGSRAAPRQALGARGGGPRRGRPAGCCSTTSDRHAPPVPSGGALSQARGGQGPRRDPHHLLERGLNRRRHAAPGRGARAGRGLVATGTEALGIGNLHNWWLETYANGGLAGLRPATRLLRRARDRAVAASRGPTPTRSTPIWRAATCGAGRLDLGAFGPSTSLSFAPMWILFGLGLAIRARACAALRAPQPALAWPRYAADPAEDGA